jgi:hypothetical protein
MGTPLKHEPELDVQRAAIRHQSAITIHAESAGAAWRRDD